MKLAKLLRGDMSINREKTTENAYEQVIMKQKKRHLQRDLGVSLDASGSLEDRILRGDFKPR